MYGHEVILTLESNCSPTTTSNEQGNFYEQSLSEVFGEPLEGYAVGEEKARSGENSLVIYKEKSPAASDHFQ